MCGLSTGTSSRTLQYFETSWHRAGIVEGLDLGHNAMAALVAQGCAEIRWLAEKMGAKPATVSGLSGLGDIMLTCYGSLSRNR